MIFIVFIMLYCYHYRYDVFSLLKAIADILSRLDPSQEVVVVPQEKCFRPPYHKEEKDPKKRAKDPYPTS
jgi:hypothetical protein